MPSLIIITTFAIIVLKMIYFTIQQYKEDGKCGNTTLVIIEDNHVALDCEHETVVNQNMNVIFKSEYSKSFNTS